MQQEAGYIKNLVRITFWHIQCSHLRYSEVASVLVSLGTQVQPQILLDPEYLPDYLCVSYDYDDSKKYNDVQIFILLLSLNNIEMSNDATFFQFSL